MMRHGRNIRTYANPAVAIIVAMLGIFVYFVRRWSSIVLNGTWIIKREGNALFRSSRMSDYDIHSGGDESRREEN